MLASMTISSTISPFVIDDNNSCSPFFFISPPLASMEKGVHIPMSEISNHYSLFPLSICMILRPVCMVGVAILSPLCSSFSLMTQGVLRSLRDLKLGLPYGSHSPCTDQPLLFGTARSSSSILLSWHLFLHLYWLSLISCIRKFSWVISMYSNSLELCAQSHYNHNTSLYDNTKQCD